MRLCAVLVLIAIAAPAASDPAEHKPAESGSVVRIEHRDPNALPSRGPANALVTIELFFTPGIGSRAAGYALIEKLQANHPSRIRLVYRIIPGNGTARLHYAALEAQAQGKFFEFMDALHGKLIENRLQSPTDAQLLELCRKIGMDPQRLALVISKPPESYTKLIEANDRRKRRKLRTSTFPSALFNGQMPKTSLSNTNLADLEAEYLRVRDEAFDLIDRGTDPKALVDAVDQINQPSLTDLTIQAGAIDEELDELAPTSPPLAKPPLSVEGFATYGPANAEVTIVVLCSPTSPNCRSPLATARNTQDMYPTAVRVVWAPYFSLARDDGADLTLLGDAALCAEKVGTASDRDELIESASPGWLWIERMRDEANNRRRRVAVEQLIEKVATKLKVDRPAFAKCRAEVAGKTVAWIEAARHAGVRTTPATVVGGRIYPPITDPNTLQQLVEAELAPGVLGGVVPSWRPAR
jgi:protein-disulfide isomerase